MCRKLVNHMTKSFKGPPCWNMLVEWENALSLQYHILNTAARKYQLHVLFVVNFVKLQLTALK